MGRSLPAAAGRLLLGSFIVLERRLRQGEAAHTLIAEAQDEGTTQLVGGAFGFAMVAGPLLARWRWGRLPAWAGWVGVSIMGAGLGLRVWSARTLGRHYTRTLRTQEDQPVIDTGPYAHIRHPGYAGTMTMWLGYGVSLTSVPAAFATTIPHGLAYHQRMRAEEAMLTRTLGGPYVEYTNRTSRILPRVY